MSTITKGPISSEGLKELDNYKYHGGEWTSLDRVMDIFWKFVISLIPEWVAPNLITFIGWLSVVFSYMIILMHDATMNGVVPNWCFFVTAFCIFFYSTLDAIDGKQARRTNSSSPLGQLFDHGCDSFSMTFFILAICQAGQVGDHEVILLLMV